MLCTQNWPENQLALAPTLRHLLHLKLLRSTLLVRWEGRPCSRRARVSACFASTAAAAWASASSVDMAGARPKGAPDVCICGQPGRKLRATT